MSESPERPGGAAEAGRQRTSAATSTAADAPDERRRRLLTWLWRVPVLLALGGGGVGAYLAYRIHFAKERPAANPQFEPTEPVAIGPIDTLAAPWDAVAFRLGVVPAIALRVPAAIAGGLSVGDAHYAAFSRICTHQQCIVNLLRDPEAIDVATNYRGDHPALVCPCHLSVFDPLRAGLVVSGPAVKPLPRVQLQLQQETLVAVGLEVTEED